MSRDNSNKECLVEEYQQRLSQIVPSGGGCAETWTALDTLRNQPSNCCGGSSDTKRRRFLRNAFASVAAAIGLSGLVSAKQASYTQENYREVTKPYQEIGAVQKAVRTTGAALLKELSTQGFLEDSSISTLPMEQISSKGEYLDRGEGTVVEAQIHQNEMSARILIGKQLDQGKLVLSVLPQADIAYAAFKKEESDLIVKPKGDQPSDSSRSGKDRYITTSACMVGQQCMLDDYLTCSQYDIYCCDDGTCYRGDMTGRCEEWEACYENCCDVCNTC